MSCSARGRGGVLITGARGWKLVSILSVEQAWVAVTVRKKNMTVEVIGMYFPTVADERKKYADNFVK